MTSLPAVMLPVTLPFIPRFTTTEPPAVIWQPSTRPPMVTLPLAVTVKPARTLPWMTTSPWTLMLPVERSTSPWMTMTLLTWNLPSRKEIWPSILEIRALPSPLATTLSPLGSTAFLPL